MKIRSVTLFAKLELPLQDAPIRHLGKVAKTAVQSYEAAGYEVQTVRLATSLFPLLAREQGSRQAVSIVTDLEARCQEAGFAFVALGPTGPDTQTWVPDILAATTSSFATCHIVVPGTGQVDGTAIRRTAQIIRAAAAIEEGFGNLRFAALANVGPGTPFFPAAFWSDATPAFGIATESADLALEACRGAVDAGEVHRRLGNAVETHGRALSQIGNRIARDQALHFAGIDFSPAPYPGPETSIGATLEALTGNRLGAPGTLAAAATLTDAIQQADFPHAGFCGLMMPVLEDSILATRAAEGCYHIGDLLQWSAVCGTGLDTIPIPGDASEAAIASLLFDVAALSVRLDKPLTARLMPLPGKQAGDPVHFDFAYFADGGVLSLDGRCGNGKLLKTHGLGLSAY